jgi:hypothetical protein
MASLVVHLPKKTARSGNPYTPMATLLLRDNGDTLDTANELAKNRVQATKEELLDDYSEKIERYLAPELKEILKNWVAVAVTREGGGAVETEDGTDSEAGREKRDWVDEQRLGLLQALRSQSDSLFCFREDGPLEKSNHAVVFGDFMVLENPTTSHALYVVDTPSLEKSSIPPVESADDFRDWLKRTLYPKIMGMAKAHLRQAYKAERVIHDPRADWAADVKAIVARRLEEKKDPKG